MVFSALAFLFFFLTITLAVYYILPRCAKNPWLFAVSIFFYGYGEPVYIILLFVSVLINYLSGLLIGRFEGNSRAKKTVLIICVILNLGLLGYFKYASLFVNTLKLLPFLSFLPNVEIVLPIGISFYTFQAMSYVIDVYRGNCKSQSNFMIFGTYVALFPQLIAGPIVRYVDVEDQLVNRRESVQMFNNGAILFIVGLSKKVLLANQFGILWDKIKPAQEIGTAGAWVGVLAFTLQIYFDFSGYSDMARGLGNMFGFEFVKNFDYPYISRSITEFWRRWHISLGTWFKEYVYIPLGGNRYGKGRQCLNIFIVWGLTGLWHGASWNFLLWGLYFGVLLTLEKFFVLKLLDRIPRFFSHLYSMFFVMFGWVIFDFTDMGEMGRYIVKLFTISGTPNSLMITVLSFVPLLIVGVIASLPIGKKIWFKFNGCKAAPVINALAALLALVLCCASLARSTYNPFLYFRF